MTVDEMRDLQARNEVADASLTLLDPGPGGQPPPTCRYSNPDGTLLPGHPAYSLGAQPAPAGGWGAVRNKENKP